MKWSNSRRSRARGLLNRLKRWVAPGLLDAGGRRLRPNAGTRQWFAANGFAWTRAMVTFRELFALAWPIAAAMLGEVAMGLVDTKLVGALGAAALAGVGMATVLMYLSYSIVFGLMRGVKVRTAYAIGQEKPADALRYAEGGDARSARGGRRGGVPALPRRGRPRLGPDAPRSQVDPLCPRLPRGADLGRGAVVLPRGAHPVASGRRRLALADDRRHRRQRGQSRPCLVLDTRRVRLARARRPRRGLRARRAARPSSLPCSPRSSCAPRAALAAFLASPSTNRSPR